MARIVKDTALPFEPLMPNAQTVGAMKAARRGDVFVAGPPDKLLSSLNSKAKRDGPSQSKLRPLKKRMTSSE